jgi:aspartyl protease family protein
MGRVEFKDSASVIVVYAEIKVGSRVIRSKLALDTGATYVMIPWEIAEALGINPELIQEKTNIITASGTEKVPIAEIESISVAGCKSNKTKVIIHDLPPSSYIDGLLGLSFLKNFTLKIDFKNGYLDLE